jgi:hypothetical protein
MIGKRRWDVKDKTGLDIQVFRSLFDHPSRAEIAFSISQKIRCKNSYPRIPVVTISLHLILNEQKCWKRKDVF